LVERESEIAARRVQLDELRERFDVQDQALENARLQFERERRRNTATQELLARLRQTLSTDLSSEFSSQQTPDAPPDDPAEIALSRDDSDFAVYEETAEPTPREWADQPRPKTTKPIASIRPAIFDAWQDDQIRRNFGPMGIDSLIDLIRAPLARRAPDGESEQQIVLIGRGAWSWAGTLAEGLIQNGTPPFMIHIADPDEDESRSGLAISPESPLRDFLKPLRFPETPDDLADSLSALDPSALISRDFLSSYDDITPWLDVLFEFSERGPCLLFSERTGVALDDVPDEIKAVGERIWERMPDRYTQTDDTQPGLVSWHETFMESHSDRGNGLLAALRSRFQLEMLAQFGFLGELFFASPIGENFDVQAARDRKFLDQIADLDDRNIEAGTVPALNLVAIVDCEGEH
jgi:hypothetical protein